MRFAGLTLLTFAVSALALPAQEPTQKDLLLAVERHLKAAHETAGPSVGCVVVSRSEQYPKGASAEDVPGRLGAFDAAEFLKANNSPANARLAKSLDLSDAKNIPDHGFGCGVVIDEKGLILTPFHVVEGATKIYVHLPGGVGSYADIHAGDGRHDLAVLRLLAPPPSLKAIKFADVRVRDTSADRANIAPGKLVVLMANPFAATFGRIEKPSAALGSLGPVRYPAAGDKQRRLDSYYDHGPLLEHDARLNAGISGAALLNLDGELIGLTTTTPSLAQGERTPGYAIPVTESLGRVIDVMRRGEEVEGGFLGVTLSKDPNAVVIGGITPYGPAAQAGLQVNDVITHVNGARVTSYPDLLGHIGSEVTGTKVKLTVRDRTQVRETSLTLGKWLHDRPVIASARPAAVFGLRVDHLSVLAQRIADNPQAFFQRDIPAGVSIREVVADSPAAAAFKKIGDDPTRRWLVTHVNGTAVSTPTEFYTAAKGQKSIKLTVIDPTEAKRPPREVSFP